MARGIAESLRMVGAGATYRDTALVARERAKRLRCDPDSGEPRFSRHGSLVMDWVEVFAPVVFEPRAASSARVANKRVAIARRCAVPRPGSRHRPAPDRVSHLQRDGVRSRAPKLWRLEAFTSKSQADWETFLGAFPGAPPRVVCDNDSGLVNAVRSRFPDAELCLCEWHLRHALERLMGKLRTESGNRDVIDELLKDVEAAFTGPSLWTPFVERARAADIPRLSEWLSTSGPVVQDQFRRRGRRSTRPGEMPLSASSLDGFINPVRAAIGPRAYGLKNRERTYRLLMLIHLHANRARAADR